MCNGWRADRAVYFDRLEVHLSIRAIATTLLLFVALQTFAGYEVEVTKATGFPASAGTVAVLPASCPSDVDCVTLNRTIAANMSRVKLRSLALPVVRQAMIDARIETITEENRQMLADKLGADSFLVVTVGSADTAAAGGTAIPIGGVIVLAPSKLARGTVEIRIVGARDGKLLMRGNGAGSSRARAETGVLAKTIARILERAFPSPLQH